MNKKLSPSKKRRYLFLVPFLILASVLMIVWSPRGLLHLRRAQLEYRDLIQKNQVLERENYQLYQKIDQLVNNPASIERLARQELGLTKEGELIFLFPSPPSETQP
jgi:cell division protein FtsB